MIVGDRSNAGKGYIGERCYLSVVPPLGRFGIYYSGSQNDL